MASNIPYNEPFQSSSVPLQQVSDEALMEWATESILDEANFLERKRTCVKTLICKNKKLFLQISVPLSTCKKAPLN